ncbi:MAG: alpha/beta hydrolase [Acidovorax sp.]
MSSAVPVCLPPHSADATIEVAPGQSVAVRLYGERKKGGPVVPLAVHFHGGAFVSGGLDNGCTVAGLLRAAGARVVSVAYPLSPFPQPQETGYAVLQWAWRNRTRLAGKGAPVYLAGEEAGGNLAAGVCMMARDRFQPPMAGLLLVSPLLDPCVGTASQREAQADGAQCKWTQGWKQFLCGARDAEHPYAVPAHAQRLAGLPPALVLTSEDDPLRDEALAYAGRLEAAGITVRKQVLRAQPEAALPDALLQPGAYECPCAPQVQAQFERFFEETRCSE